MLESIPSARYSSICSALRLWSTEYDVKKHISVIIIVFWCKQQFLKAFVLLLHMYYPPTLLKIRI